MFETDFGTELEESRLKTERQDIVHVPTPKHLLPVIIHAISPSSNQLLVDLGCGTGDVVLEASRLCRADGYDIEPELINIANRKRSSNVARFACADIFGMDIAGLGADILYLHLTPDLNVCLLPQLVRCRPDTMIFSYQFDMLGVAEPLEVLELISGHVLCKWVTPLRVRPERLIESDYRLTARYKRMLPYLKECLMRGS